jgi:hypothetical protein
MRKAIRIVAVLVFVLSTPVHAHADLIARHQGEADPTTESFSLWPFNGGISASPVANDMGRSAWSISSLSPGSQQAAYLHDFTAADQTALLSQGFTVSLVARAVSGPVYASPTFEPIAAAIVGFFNSGGPDLRYDLELGLDAQGNTVAILANSIGVNGDGSFNVPGASAVVSGNGYHLYQLAFNPISQTADLFIDGVDRIQGYQGHADNRFRGFYFGSLDLGTGNYNLAELDTGILTGVVPEPSTLILGGAGALLWLGYAVGLRRRRL